MSILYNLSSMLDQIRIIENNRPESISVENLTELRNYSLILKNLLISPQLEGRPGLLEIADNIKKVLDSFPSENSESKELKDLSNKLFLNIV